MSHSPPNLLSRIRWLTGLFIFGLVVSGATALPLQSELGVMVSWSGNLGNIPALFQEWLLKIHASLQEIGTRYPFLAYGTDWLAFGHFMIALAFVGAWRDPVRNKWLFDFRLIACALVIPYAFILGAVRGIPIWWRLIDCSFGVLGAIPLWFCKGYTQQLERLQLPLTTKS